MKVVERYIMRRTFVLFMGTLLWTLAIVWTTQVLARIDLVTDSGQSALTFFQVASLIIPSIIPVVVPFALVVAVAQTLSTMNADSELVVISAAGSSRLTVVRPILLLALAAGLLCFVVHNGLDPYARQKNRELVASARADFLSLIIQEGTFRKVEDGLFVQIGERFPDSRLGGIFVADSREPGVDLIYYAKTGAIIDRGDKKVLLMNDGVVNRKVPSGDVSVVRFTAYAFDLSAFASDTGDAILLPKDQTTQYLLNPDANDPTFKESPGLYRTELNIRFSEWLFPIAFALIALAVAGDPKSHREARIHPLITAIVICLAVRWLAFFAEGESKSTPFLGYMMYAIPILASLISILFIRVQKTMELPMNWVDAGASVFRGIRDRLTGAPSRQGAA
ncbi:MAG TPA: LPS export ABC transporter permease LptF [Mesorhizobium sp.]